MLIPDGFFINGLIFWGRSLSKRTWLSKGVRIESPDLAASSVAALNQFHDEVSAFLASMEREFSIQVQWAVDADYGPALGNYATKTNELFENASGWSTFAREERYQRYRAAMEQGVLRRESVTIFMSRNVQTIPQKGFTTRRQIQMFLDQEGRNLEQQIRAMGTMLTMCNLKIMGDYEHYVALRRFFNPGQAALRIDPEDFDPDAPILENCMSSDGYVTAAGEGFAIRMDDRWNSFFVVRRWPQVTVPGLISRLTSAVGHDYAITANVYARDVESEIRREETEIRKLQGGLVHEQQLSLEGPISQKRDKIRALTEGYTKPLEMTLIVRLWATSAIELIEKNQMIKAALSAMGGAGFHQVNHPSQAKRIFYATFPGYLGAARDWAIYGENQFLADMLPLSSTNKGFVEEGEALYDGVSGNLVGVRTFAGHTPQHTVVLGMTGAGKSALMVDLLSQTDPFYGYTAIIEEGMSYATFTQLQGCEPIIVRTDGDMTLNYFDTLGLPLSGQQFSVAEGLLLKMIGRSGDEDTNKRRQALLGEYLAQVYDDQFQHWSQLHPEAAHAGRIEAMVYERLKQEAPPGMGDVEVFHEMRKAKGDPEAWAELTKGISEEAVQLFAVDPRTRVAARNYAFSLMRPEDFPVHTGLVEMLRYGRMSHHNKEETDYLSTMLSAWQRDGGSHGVLFDGVSNQSLNGRVSHFELGFLPESATSLKEAVVFLIANYVRQHIVSMPRGVRKRLIFEELRRFADIPGGDKVIAEAYAQLRKAGCWVASVFQQYEQLRGCGSLASVVFGNSKQFILLRQQDKHDVDHFGDMIGLPTRARSEILRFPLPEKQQGRKFASFGVFVPEGDASTFGVCRNFVSDEMLYVAASDGALFDRRMRAMRKYGGDPLQMVWEESHRERVLAEEKAREKVS